MNCKKILVSTFAAGLVFAATALPTFADTTVVVTSPALAVNVADVIAHPTKWFFYNDETDTIDNTLGSFVSGPSTAPFGAGSAQISVAGTQRRNLATYQFSGTKLSDIMVLKFSTYNPSAGNGGGANRSGYLNFNVDFNGSDTWQRRLVYVPSQNGSVVQDSWKEWDAINGGNAMWTWSGFAGNGNKWPDNNTNEYRTWSDIVSAFPNIRVRVTDSWLGIRVGEPYADGYTENIDGFKFGTAAGTTTYDFDPYVAPSVPTITVPANGAHVTSAALVKVDWSNSTGTNPPFEYQYEAYGDSGYSSLIYSSGWLSSSEIPTPGTPVGDYWIRVRAKDATGTMSTWSNDTGNPYHFTVDPLIGPPTLVSQCKNNGWQTFNNPSFKDQGTCVSYVRAHSHSVLGNVKYTVYGLARTAQFAADTADGGGAFQYSDANHAWYRVLITSLKVDGHNAWFAGRVWQASNPSWVGQWLFAKVNDSSPKRIWGSFTTQSAAENGVATMATPADGPFNTIGALVVH